MKPLFLTIAFCFTWTAQAQFFDLDLLPPNVEGSRVELAFTIANFRPDLGDTVAVIVGPPGEDLEAGFLNGGSTEIQWTRVTSSPVRFTLLDGSYEALALHLSGLFDSVEPGFRQSEIMARSEVVGFDISTSDPFVDRRPFLDLQFGFPLPASEPVPVAWGGLEDVDSWLLEWDRDPNFPVPELSRLDRSVSTAVIPIHSLSGSGRLYVRVRGLRESSLSQYSEILEVPFEILEVFEYLIMLPKSGDFDTSFAVDVVGSARFDFTFPQECVFDPECATLATETAQLTRSGLFDLTSLVSRRPALITSTSKPLAASIVITDRLRESNPLAVYQIPPYRRSRTATLTGLVERSAPGLAVVDSAVVIISFNEQSNPVTFTYQDLDEQGSRSGGVVVPPYGASVVWLEDLFPEGWEGVANFRFQGGLPILVISATFNDHIPNYSVGAQE